MWCGVDGRERREHAGSQQREDRSDRRVISDMLDRAFEKGYSVSVKEGNEWVVKRSMDKDEIMGELGMGGSNYLLFRKDDVKVGSMVLTFGSRNDGVISDYTANPEMEFLVQGLDEPVAFAAESVEEQNDEVILVLDDTTQDGHPDFYLNVPEGTGKKFVDLKGMTLPSARREAKEKGYEPKKWYRVSTKSMTNFL